MRLIFPEFLDNQLTAFEADFFGIDPSLWLDKNLINVWIDRNPELLLFFLLLDASGFSLELFLLKRYDAIKPSLDRHLHNLLSVIFLFFFYPLEGPRYFFSGQYLHA